MRFLDEFRDPSLAAGLLDELKGLDLAEPVTFMEVCGSHTMALSRLGLREVLPQSITLVSGPGCPVCVSPVRFLDHALSLGRVPDVILATFGDLIRVPGTESTLQEARAQGADVRVVYSPLDALTLARGAPDRRVVFLGIGFETTAPAVAASLLVADKEGVENYFVLSDHKVMPPPMRVLSEAPDIALRGYLCPGHVSAVIGSDAYTGLARDCGISCVVAGFEPLDILQAVLLLARQARDGVAAVENAYPRAVRPGGNPAALRVMDQVFEPQDAEWRGFGTLPDSGLAIRPEFGHRDARRAFPLDVPEGKEPPGCRCADVLRGVLRPPECGLFGTVCTLEDPIGACMVSSEGTCAAYFAYGRGGA